MSSPGTMGRVRAEFHTQPVRKPALRSGFPAALVVVSLLPEDPRHRSAWAKIPKDLATSAEPACRFPEGEPGLRNKLYNFDHL